MSNRVVHRHYIFDGALPPEDRRLLGPVWMQVRDPDTDELLEWNDEERELFVEEAEQLMRDYIA